MSSFTEPLEYEFSGTFRKTNPIYIVTKEFRYCVGDHVNPIMMITVPSGYMTDLATVPWPINKVFRPNGQWAKAAVIHDFLYTDRFDISKVISDSIFLEAMLILGISEWIAYPFYMSVRIYQQWFSKTSNKRNF